MNYTFRPLPDWPHPPTRERRSRWTFKAAWGSTIALLRSEVEKLDGENVVIGAGLCEADIRMDGLPRANARVPSHPGVELSFDTARHGRIVYATDVCEWWEHNIRSIALGLEALRAVDRYGITRHGEQYAGFRQLPRGDDDGSVERGGAIVVKYGSLRAALMETHPDRGGSERDFRDVQAWRDSRGF